MGTAVGGISWRGQESAVQGGTAQSREHWRVEVDTYNIGNFLESMKVSLVSTLSNGKYRI